jgi:uncharacterized membrane protein
MEPVAQAVTGTATDVRARENLVVALLIVLHTAIALPLALWLNVWIDESYTLYTTALPLGDLLKHCKEFQLHPPFYYMLVWLWRMLDDSIPFLRSLSVILSVAGLWFVHLSCRRWFPKLRTPWVILPLAVNPWMLYAATEIRPYCLVPFWSAALLYLYYGGFVSERPRWIEKILFAIAATLALYTFYYIGFMLPAGALVLLVWRKWRLLRDYVALMIVTGMLILPQVALSMRDSRIYTQGVSEHPTLWRSIEFVAARAFAMVSGLFSFPEFARMGILVVFALAAMAAIVLRTEARNIRNTALPVIAAVVALIYLALVWFGIGENMFYRHFMPALIPLHLAIASIAARVPQRRFLAAKGFMGALTILCVISSTISFAPMAKVGDYRRVAAFLEAEEEPGERIFVAVSHAEYPLRVYYNGENEIVPVPFHDDLTYYDPRLWRIHTSEEVVDVLATVKSGESFWVFTDRPRDDDFLGVPTNLHLLEDVLDVGFELQSERDFYFAKLRKFVRE